MRVGGTLSLPRLPFLQGRLLDRQHNLSCSEIVVSVSPCRTPRTRPHHNTDGRSPFSLETVRSCHKTKAAQDTADSSCAFNRHNMGALQEYQVKAKAENTAKHVNILPTRKNETIARF